MVLDLRMPGIDGIGVLERMQQWSVERRPHDRPKAPHGSVPLAVRAIRLGASDSSRNL